MTSQPMGTANLRKNDYVRTIAEKVEAMDDRALVELAWHHPDRLRALSGFVMLQAAREEKAEQRDCENTQPAGRTKADYDIWIRDASYGR